MAVKSTKKGPSIPLVRPIQQATSRGVVEKGERALLEHRSKGLPAGKVQTPNGFSLGTQQGGGGSVSGASV